MCILKKCQVSVQSNQSSNISMVPLPILVNLCHHWWSSCNPCNWKYHLSLSCPYMRQWCYSHKGMGIDIHCWVTHFHVCKMFLSGTFSVVQCSSSIGTVWKSSSSDELSDELSASWSQHQCEGAQDGWLVYVVLCLFLDNSDSPSIVEQ